MIVLSFFWIGAIALSVIAWFLICLATMLFMFGDDKALIVGPFLATVLVVLFWLIQTGVIRFVA